MWKQGEQNANNCFVQKARNESETESDFAVKNTAVWLKKSIIMPSNGKRETIANAAKHYNKLQKILKK
ncbi:MAG: hypothetical protein J6D08_16635 [Lachnospiraceae bacterium]|nr:hypothetical protein [Lachnospiraceae bacterium]